MKHPLEMLVKILVNGGRVEHDGYVHAMTEEGGLCVIMKDDNDQDFPLGIDCDVKGLYKMANDIGKDQLWLQCCAIELGNMNKKDRKISLTD